MAQFERRGFPLIGVMFIALGIFKLVQGGNWVVWIILGALFGGLSVLSRRKDQQP